MEGIVCDRCDDELLVESDVRYVMKVDVQAAYDPMELTREDLQQDFQAEFEKILRQLEGSSKRELNDQVHYQAKLDLCPRCQREVLKFLGTRRS